MQAKFSIILAALFASTSVVSVYIPRVAEGTQFITGPCTSDLDCASGCCGFHSGLCAGAIIAQTRDGGCGFGNASPNNVAATADQDGQDPFQAIKAAVAAGTVTEANASGTAPATPAAPASSAPAANNASGGSFTAVPGGSGKALGAQFITGQCSSDLDCASGCCGFHSGLCAGAVIAQTRDGGCGFGNTTPNNIAALADQNGQDPFQAAQAAETA